MKKIFNLLGSIAKDKLLHFICGEFITLTVFLVLSKLVPLLETLLVSFCVCFLIAVAKEFYDKFNKGNCSIKDIIATLFGGIIALIFGTLFVL